MAVKRFSPVSEYEYRERSNGAMSIRRQYLAVLSDNKNPYSQLKRHRPDLQKWQPHEYERECLVTSFEAVPRKHSLIYDITVDWSNDVAEQEDPLDRAPIIEAATSFITLPVYKTYNGEPLVNTAGQLLEGTEEEYPLITFSIRKNVANFPTWLADAYEMATNSDLCEIDGIRCPPRTLKIARLHIGPRQTENETDFRVLSLDLVRNKNTWDRFFLNRGTEEIVAVKANYTVRGQEYIARLERQPMKNRLGEYVSEPAFLDEEGRRPRVDAETGKLVTLADELKAIQEGRTIKTKIKEPLDPEDIIILRKEVREPLPFSVFGLF